MNFNRRTQDIKKITSFQDPNLYKFLSPNVTVWVKLKTPEESLNLFKKALIITVDLMKNLVKVRFLDPHPSKTKVNEEYNIKDVYKVNTLYRPQGFDDMGNMLLVNEAEILWNLRLRFLENIQYSYIGPILLFMNSKNLPPGLFSKTNINFYQKMLQKDEVLNSKDFFPHIYGILSDAIKGLRVKDQVLIFHGQNNSGKSLNFAKAAEFLGVLNKEREIKKGIDDFLDISGNDIIYFLLQPIVILIAIKI